MAIQQETDYPWRDVVNLRVTPRKGTWRGTMQPRIPEWCRTNQWSGGLYRVQNHGSWTLMINGNALDARTDLQGYVAIERVWESGDTNELHLEMPILRVDSHADVIPNRGRIALQRGPLVFCVEDVDNGGNVRKLRLPRNAELQSEWDSDLLGGVMKIRCSNPELTAIPYGYWANRMSGERDVWIQE